MSRQEEVTLRSVEIKNVLIVITAGIAISAANGMLVGLAMAGDLPLLLGVVSFLSGLITAGFSSVIAATKAGGRASVFGAAVITVTLFSLASAGWAAGGTFDSLPALHELTAIYYIGITLISASYLHLLHQTK